MTLMALALIGTLALCAITLYWWPTLPATIPTHFGVDGRPNAYGSKNTTFLLPGIQIVMLLLFGVLARYPWIYNYPVTITSENAERQYRRGRTLLTTVNAVLAWFFLAIQWQTIQVARGATSTLGGLFSLPMVIAFIVLFPLAMLALIMVWVTRGK